MPIVKVALLIGVSEYGYGLEPLPEAVKDISAMARVLESSEMGGFDEVKTLIDPNPPAMREAIQAIFADLHKNDVVLLFFSGNRVQDRSGKLYLATSITATLTTEAHPQGELVKATAVPVSFVRDIANNCPCQNQVAILNWYFHPVLSQGIVPERSSAEDNLHSQMSGERLAILTSNIDSQVALDRYNPDISVYTRYVVEGIETGSADRDRDGWISAEDLQEYVKRRVTEAAPAWIPEFYFSHNRQKIILTKVKINDEKIKYRQEVERWASRGQIAQLGIGILAKLGIGLQLNYEDCRAIEAEVMKPYREYEQRLARYEVAFTKYRENFEAIGTEFSEELLYLRKALGLRYEDVVAMEEKVNLGENSSSIWQTATPINLGEEEKNNLLNNPVESEANQREELPNISEENSTAILQPIIPLPLVIFSHEDEDNGGKESNGETNHNSISSPPSALPWYIKTPPLPLRNQTSTLDLSSQMADSPKNQILVSNLSKKILPLIVGIGGIIASLFVAISLANRSPIISPDKPENSPPSSNYLSPTSSHQVTETDEVLTPDIEPSLLRKGCWVIVNGNIRSEPASFRENVINFTKEELLVTGKQTEGGWIQVKLANGGLAWAHRDAIQNDTEMDICILRDGVKIERVDDIIPPPAPLDGANPDPIDKSRR